MTAFLLILGIWLNDGRVRVAEQPQPTLGQCLEKAGEFLKQQPEEFGAVALSAMCINRQTGDPA